MKLLCHYTTAMSPEAVLKNLQAHVEPTDHTFQVMSMGSGLPFSGQVNAKGIHIRSTKRTIPIRVFTRSAAISPLLKLVCRADAAGTLVEIYHDEADDFENSTVLRKVVVFCMIFVLLLIGIIVAVSERSFKPVFWTVGAAAVLGIGSFLENYRHRDQVHIFLAEDIQRIQKIIPPEPVLS